MGYLIIILIFLQAFAKAETSRAGYIELILQAYQAPSPKSAASQSD